MTARNYYPLPNIEQPRPSATTEKRHVVDDRPSQDSFTYIYRDVKFRGGGGNQRAWIPAISVWDDNQEDYMTRSILATIFCFLPTGICAIIESCKAKREFANGNIVNGQISAAMALKLSNVSIAIGCISLIVFCAYIVYLFSPLIR